MNKITGLLCALCLAALPVLAHAIDSFSMKQASAVQAQPEKGSAVLEQLRIGQVVLKIKQQNGWAQVFFMNDIDEPVKGWVPAAALGVIGETAYEPAVPDGVGEDVYNSRVTANSLRVRAGAGTNFGVVGRLVNNQQVVRLKTEAAWSQVRFKADDTWQEGWVASKYLAAN